MSSESQQQAQLKAKKLNAAEATAETHVCYCFLYPVKLKKGLRIEL